MVHHFYRYSLLFFIFISIFIHSCKDEDIEFIDVLTIRFPISIPAGLNPLETHYLEYIDVETQLMAVLEQNNIDTSDISFIRPQFAELRSFNGARNFDFLNQAFLEVGNVSERFIEAFYIDRVPENEDSILDLIPNEVNLKSRIDRSRLNARLILRLKRSNALAFDAQLTMRFFIQ